VASATLQYLTEGLAGSAAFGAVGSIEVGEAREEEPKDDQPGMKPVSEWKPRKPKQRRKRGEYIS